MSAVGLIMDVFLAVLLLTAIGFGWKLEKKLKALRQGQESFAQAVRELDGAARRAEAGLANLREATDEAHDSLHDRILKARELKQQLDAQLARAERTPAPAALTRAPAPAERARTAFTAAAAPEPRASDRPAPRRFDEDLFESGASR